LLNRIIAIGGLFAVVSTVAFAQTAAVRQTPPEHLKVQVEPDASVRPAPVPVADADLNQLRLVIAAARTGDVEAAKAAAQPIKAPTARKVAQWVLVDIRAEQLGFADIDAARRDLADWPRAGKRRQQAEAMIETAGLDPTAIVGWFAAEPPKTAPGAMALAAAYQSTGHPEDAQALIRKTWRTQVFEADVQKSLLARFGGLLTSDDHVARANLLLYGPQGPAL
jgi:soluble lytic murein transglycosylase